ncbi:MAG: hypothetical protein V9E93_02275 [Steroidobacteraceae bacterium]
MISNPLPPSLQVRYRRSSAGVARNQASASPSVMAALANRFGKDAPQGSRTG